VKRSEYIRASPLFLIYWAMQTIAAVAFKWGTTADGRWLPMFIFGNAVGASSIWFMMLLYRHLHPNIVLGVCVGGAFLCAQISVAILFHSQLNIVQCFGLASITAGMMLLAFGGSDEPNQVESARA